MDVGAITSSDKTVPSCSLSVLAVPGGKRTAAELTSAEKGEGSHRALAEAALRPKLVPMLPLPSSVVL